MTQVLFKIPGPVVGKGRPRFAKRGKFVQTYTPETTVNYENLVKLAASEAMANRTPIKSAVSLELTIMVTPPASWSEKKRSAACLGGIHPTTKPDVDNVLKAIADAMNGIVYDDDKQIVQVTVVKKYAANANAIVRVVTL